MTPETPDAFPPPGPPVGRTRRRGVIVGAACAAAVATTAVVVLTSGKSGSSPAAAQSPSTTVTSSEEPTSASAATSTSFAVEPTATSAEPSPSPTPTPTPSPTTPEAPNVGGWTPTVLPLPTDLDSLASSLNSGLGDLVTGTCLSGKLPDSTTAVAVGNDVKEVPCLSGDAHYKVIQSFQNTTDLGKCDSNPKTQFEFSSSSTRDGFTYTEYVYCLIGMGTYAR